MQCNIKIGSFKAIKPHSLSWRRSLANYSDMAVFIVPGVARLHTTDNQYAIVNSAEQFAEGMAVSAFAGYNDVQQLRFMGFIRHINYTIPVEVECEGYSYLLRKKEGYTASYKTTTAKEVLTDLCAGTLIKISNDIPDIPLEKIFFKNVKGTDVLEYLKEKCLLSVYFKMDTLYCGLLMPDASKTVKLRLGWNVIKDNDLKFETNRELAKVNLQIEFRNKDGSKVKVQSGPADGEVKVLKIENVYDPGVIEKIVQRLKNKIIFRGYEGMITLFATPYIEPGNAAYIFDKRYPQRTGTYFVEAVDGDFSKSGGRQKVKIGASL